MTKEERDIQRKLKVLRHAERIGGVAKTCRYFGVGRSSFYRWRAAYEQRGEAGLVNAKPIPKNPANQTPPEVVEKVLYPCKVASTRVYTESAYFRHLRGSWGKGLALFDRPFRDRLERS